MGIVVVQLLLLRHGRRLLAQRWTLRTVPLLRLLATLLATLLGRSLLLRRSLLGRLLSLLCALLRPSLVLRLLLVLLRLLVLLLLRGVNYHPPLDVGVVLPVELSALDVEVDFIAVARNEVRNKIDFVVEECDGYRLGIVADGGEHCFLFSPLLARGLADTIGVCSEVVENQSFFHIMLIKD